MRKFVLLVLTIILECGIISNVVAEQPHVAGVAQSVVQLIRNQQVVCSSHITSSKNKVENHKVLHLVFRIGFSAKNTSDARIRHVCDLIT